MLIMRGGGTGPTKPGNPQRTREDKGQKAKAQTDSGAFVFSLFLLPFNGTVPIPAGVALARLKDEG
jgi:hypothetical protein